MIYDIFDMRHKPGPSFMHTHINDFITLYGFSQALNQSQIQPQYTIYRHRGFHATAQYLQHSGLPWAQNHSPSNHGVQCMNMGPSGTFTVHTKVLFWAQFYAQTPLVQQLWLPTHSHLWYSHLVVHLINLLVQSK